MSISTIMTKKDMHLKMSYAIRKAGQIKLFLFVLTMILGWRILMTQNLEHLELMITQVVLLQFLETSRILYEVDSEDSVQFVFFSGEEQGLWGSKHYAQYLKDSNVNLHRLINLDMVGYPPSGKLIIVIERDMGNAVTGNDQDSQRFGEIMEQTSCGLY